MYDTAFDVLYWSLGGVMLLALLAAIVRSARRLHDRASDRPQAEGSLAIATGALLALVAGFGLEALRSATGDLFYQQAHFALFYIGFGLVLWGFDRVGLPGDRASSGGTLRRLVAWGAFGLATLLALSSLLTPDGYRLISGGDVRYVQEPLFFLPLFVALGTGATGLVRWLDAAERHTGRPWFAAVAAWMLLGMLREATIIASTGQPIVDLLLAFGPFTLGALCLYRAASIGDEPERMPAEAAASPT